MLLIFQFSELFFLNNFVWKDFILCL